MKRKNIQKYIKKTNEQKKVKTRTEKKTCMDPSRILIIPDGGVSKQNRMGST